MAYIRSGEYAASVPAHVRPEHVYAYDIENIPGAEEDFYREIVKLQRPGVPEIFWTPHNGGHWVFTRGEDIEATLKNHAVFSSTPLDGGPAEPPLFFDPPEHGEYKSVIVREFSPASIDDRTEEARATAIALIEGFRRDGACEFVADFAYKFPIVVFMNLFGFPLADRERLIANVHAQRTARTVEASQAERRVLRDYSAERVEERRTCPRDDMITRMMAFHVKGEPLDDEVLVDFVVQIAGAGLDTVASALTIFTRFLATSPAHRRQLADDPARIPRAVEELLRRFALATFGRHAIAPFDYKGVRFEPGDRVMLPTALYGLDPRRFERPMEVDFARKAPLHAAFGLGVHRCIGSMLARMELRVFLEEWLARIPDFSLAAGPEPRMRPGVVLTMHSLPLVWPASAAALA